VLERIWKKRNQCTLLIGMQIGIVNVENSMVAPQKIKMEILYDPIVLLLGIYLKKAKILIEKIYSPLYLLWHYFQ